MSEQSKHIANWFKSWWFAIAFGLSVLGVSITTWFQLQFVIAAVNPEAIAEYEVRQAVLEVKREVRWCLGKLLIDGQPISKQSVLKCAD